jgi:hypothetical protein
MKVDFSGYATKVGLKCTDGRTILAHAFKECDGLKVPLVWQHGHNDPNNVLGHAILEHREDGVYAYAYFNDTGAAKNAKMLVQHGDITALSIYANQLVERSKNVVHGIIREVSLVMSGANPGALIDNVSIAHSDGDMEFLDDEAVIYTGLTLAHSSEEDDDLELEHVANSDMTVQDVYDAFTDVQKNVVHYMIGVALETPSAAHSDSDEDDLTHKEGQTMNGSSFKRNVFEQNPGVPDKHALSHEDVKGIVADAIRGGSLKEAVENYALKHGIENIELLFPDAKTLSNTPEIDKRRTEWVANVLNNTRHTPFARIKSLTADLTFDEARAKGYITGNMKKEEFFPIAKRVTIPTTIYKKQKLDRDDIVDITDFDVVVWIKAEMRMMLEEELARAVLFGDGRAIDDEDKINATNIRPISTDAELYATTINVEMATTDADYQALIEEVLLARRFYKGTGTPTFYTTEETLVRMLLIKDTLGRRIYNSENDLISALRVSAIVPVEAMEGEEDLLGIIVNLADYSIGADRGGEITLFDDFDIDYNKYTYLIETRCSGALTKIKSALIVRKVDVTLVRVTPPVPAFDASKNTLTIPTTDGVTYTVDGVAKTGKVVITSDVDVHAYPEAGYGFEESADEQWIFSFVPPTK